MKAKAALVVVGVMALVLVGCMSPVIPGATSEGGVVTFSAEGTSVLAKADDAMALEEAKVAAATIAKANLLGRIKGELLTNKVNVEGLMLASEAASIRTQGWLSRATIEYVKAEKVVSPMTVTAIATLKVNACELRQLKTYAE